MEGEEKRYGGWEVISNTRNLFVPEPGCQGGYCHHVLHPPHLRWVAHRTHPLATAPWTAARHPPPLLATFGTGSSTWGGRVRKIRVSLK